MHYSDIVLPRMLTVIHGNKLDCLVSIKGKTWSSSVKFKTLPYIKRLSARRFCWDCTRNSSNGWTFSNWFLVIYPDQRWIVQRLVSLWNVNWAFPVLICQLLISLHYSESRNTGVNNRSNSWLNRSGSNNICVFVMDITLLY